MHNEHKTIENLISRLKAGENIALISDAGTQQFQTRVLLTPCVENGITVECLAQPPLYLR
jgi:16S rRNA (cytidine1402-2'-O)-methyltransferase